jgi:tripartite-type tricarboxylate transporter receptor subunit TctC
MILLVFGLMCMLGVSSTVEAAYPDKKITILLTSNPGSTTDLDARAIAPYLEKYLGVNILIDNRPGADGRIGVNDAWKAAPDGYTLVNPAMPIPIISEKIYQVNYRTREFTHIFAWSVDNVVLVETAEKTEAIPLRPDLAPAAAGRRRGPASKPPRTGTSTQTRPSPPRSWP